MNFSRNVLDMDLEARSQSLAASLKTAVVEKLRRRGLVVAVSGGIDSACVAALAARALGPNHVFGLLLPERDSSGKSTELGRKLCETLKIPYTQVDIAPALEALGCYRARDAAVKSVMPEFESHWPWKIVMDLDRLNTHAINVFYVVVKRPDGEKRARLTSKAYLEIVAATNFKQRTRKMLEYYHADRLVYAVGGTPNRLEYDQGFFVKLGDGAADVKPIASLYKTQVYKLAGHLGVIPEILQREPTTDTYSLDQSQEEFYFSVNFRDLDLILWAKSHQVSTVECAGAMGFTPQQIQHVYDDIDQKRRTTAYLHAAPVLLEPVGELDAFK